MAIQPVAARRSPFRGKGIGRMPSLEEVLANFPDRRFMINIKSRDPSEGEKLTSVLQRLPVGRRAQLLVSGGEEPIAELRRQLPEVRTVSRGSLKACLIRYIATGWTGYVPVSCHSMAVLVPINIAPWLWGWPDRFLPRMSIVNSEVFALGLYSGGEFSTGIDTAADLARLPPGYSGGIWTNEIEHVAGALRSAGE